jgi:ribosomal protein S18 acetylase RimI-like enzyme
MDLTIVKMTVKTLENTTIEEILTVFNSSFSNSILPFELTKEQFEHKINNDSINLKYSAGAFIDNQLIGFILHGIDNINNEIVAYNAGTGVDPNFRGNKIISQIYAYIIPILKNSKVTKMQLEVISGNEKAISIYRSIGFKINRELNCYKGFIKPKSDNKYEIRALHNYDWELMQSFWDIMPSWQNDVTALKNSQSNNKSVGIFDNELMLGYLIYHPISNKIQQLAIDKKHRRKGIGSLLLNYIAENNNSELIANNIDPYSKDTSSFFLNAGLDIRMKQYEMSLEI